MIFRHLLNMRSHPTWVRGLKQQSSKKLRNGLVAPYVGAWIETRYTLDKEENLESHPTWVRGLKHFVYPCLQVQVWSHPTWVRGLKLIRVVDFAKFSCRTLRGCVD